MIKQNKSKLYYLFSLLVLALILTSCSFNSNSNVELKKDYAKGYSDLNLEFIDNNPTDEVPENTLFSIGLTLHNEGASNIEEGFLSLNYDKDYINLFSNNFFTFVLEGKNPFNSEGEQRDFFMDGQTLNLDKESFSRDIPLIASACYIYENVLEDTVCVDKSYVTSGDVGEKICSSKDLSYSGQGGPVGISKINMVVLVDKSANSATPVLDITFKHNGKGIVTDIQNYRAMCTGKDSNADDLNSLRIKEISLSGVPLICNKDDSDYGLSEFTQVKLKNNIGRVRCELSQDIYLSQMPYEAPLRIVYDYSYLNVETNTVKLVNFN